MAHDMEASARRGASTLVREAEFLLAQVIAQHGPKVPIGFPETSFYLPTILGMTGIAVDRVGQLEPVLRRANELLDSAPGGSTPASLPSATLDAGMAALYAAESIAALRLVRTVDPGSRHTPGPIDDLRVRSCGLHMVDGHMPCVALILGAAPSNEEAAKLIVELRKRGVVCFLSGGNDQHSLIDQLEAQQVPMGYEACAMPFGTDAVSAVYATGFATRRAMVMANLKPGMRAEILDVCRREVPAFLLMLGESDDLKCAMAAGAMNFGFAIITATTGEAGRMGAVAPYALYSDAVGRRLGDAGTLVAKCIEARGLSAAALAIELPVPYGPGFDGEVMHPEDVQVKYDCAQDTYFELVRSLRSSEIEDGRTRVVGDGLGKLGSDGPAQLGILVEVAGRKMEASFESLLERRLHTFVNAMSGVQHAGSGAHATLELSRAALKQGLKLEDIGRVLHARFRHDFSELVEAAQVTLITEPQAFRDALDQASRMRAERDGLRMGLRDESVDEFYACRICSTFAAGHVCIISPERPGLCGAYDWLDCRALHAMHPTGKHVPIKIGRAEDAIRGYWSEIDQFVEAETHGSLRQVALYSAMENPMTACGCSECVVVQIPEANGVIVVSRDDHSMTPAGMDFATLAVLAGGGRQTQGVMGIGRDYLLSRKFISADGGFKRVLWMSADLKQSLSPQLRVVCEREGDPGLLEKIADGESVNSVQDLMTWLQAKTHPALEMAPAM